ncbi:MAG: ferrous iron transport protein A [candidate division Zixibacteria bacterium]|nr:ferrous iron transport protein A [candidate division Zixibacteria bacterium]
MEKLDLTQLKEGKVGVVVDIQGGFGLIRRLEVLGIRVDEKVIKVSSQFAKGPVTLKVGNTQVALGFGIAKKIIVRAKEK